MCIIHVYYCMKVKRRVSIHPETDIPLKEWRTSEDFERVDFKLDMERRQRIGQGHEGLVYAAEVVWKEKDYVRPPNTRVAVKFYHTPLTDDDARELNRIIADMKGSGMEIPPTSLIKLKAGTHVGYDNDDWGQTPKFGVYEGKLTDDRWVYVQWLYANKNGSNLAGVQEGIVLTDSGRDEIGKRMVREAEHGFYPHRDMYTSTRNQPGKVIISDIGLYNQRREEGPMAETIVYRIARLSKYHLREDKKAIPEEIARGRVSTNVFDKEGNSVYCPKEFIRLLDVAIKAASQKFAQEVYDAAPEDFRNIRKRP